MQKGMPYFHHIANNMVKEYKLYIEDKSLDNFQYIIGNWNEFDKP